MDALIDRILGESKTIAVVGVSDKRDRPSHRVASYLARAGFRVVPVNPNLKEVLGQKAYASLSEIPVPVDLVDVFRRSDNVPPLADEAVRIGAKFFWMQEGVRSDAAAAALARAGIPVVMDRCIMKELAARGR